MFFLTVMLSIERSVQERFLLFFFMFWLKWPFWSSLSDLCKLCAPQLQQQEPLEPVPASTANLQNHFHPPLFLSLQSTRHWCSSRTVMFAFDGSCQSCFKFSVQLWYSVALKGEMASSISVVVFWCTASRSSDVTLLHSCVFHPLKTSFIALGFSLQHLFLFSSVALWKKVLKRFILEGLKFSKVFLSGII